MKKGQNLQDTYLRKLVDERIPVSIFLVNGIKLQGTVDNFDQFIVTLKNVATQVIYKHAISTIMPSRNVRMTSAENSEAEES